MIEPQREPASKTELDELDRLTEGRLPREYIELLSLSNGFEARLPISPYCVILNPVESVIKGIKGQSCEVPDGFLMIGTDGAGELIVLDMRKDPPWIACIPGIGLELEYLYLLSKTFAGLLELCNKRAQDFSMDDELGREIILSNAEVARNAEQWNSEQVKEKSKYYKLDVYAPGFRPIAGTRSGQSFIAINEEDESVCEVSVWGLKFSPPNKLADSMEQLEQFLAQTEDDSPDEWRYYERDDDEDEGE